MEESMEQQVEKTKKREPKESKKVRLTIHSGEDSADKGDVVLVHNFRQILIQRDKEVVVDECYLEVLKHSTIETNVKGEDGVVRPVRVARYAFSASPA